MSSPVVPSRTSHRLVVVIGSLLLAFVVLGFFRFVPTVSSHSARLEEDLNQHFLQHEVVQLDSQTVSQKVRETGRLSLATADMKFDLELVPHDLRAPNYRAEEFGADGVGHAINIGPVRTFKGRARDGQQGKHIGEARFTIDEQSIEGLIITPTEHYFVEPARKFSEAASTAEYVIYKESDVVTNSTSECGLTLSEQVNQKVESVRQENTEAFSQLPSHKNQTSGISPTVEKHAFTPDGPVSSQSSLLNFDSPKSGFVWDPLTLLKSDAAQLSQAKPPNIQTPLAPGCGVETINSGQQLNRTLDFGCSFQGGQLTDIFTFSGIAGQQVSITMTSNAFDTKLYLWYGPDGPRFFATQDDNGAGGTDSRIPTATGTYVLPATATYFIYASSVLANQTGRYKLAFSLTTPLPANDSFANAQLISDVAGSVASNNLNATKENGEPNHAGNAGGASVWYRWQAPTNGTATFDTAASNFNTLLAVYTGASVGSLTAVAGDNDFNGSLQSRVSFEAVQGTTYYIAVDGLNGATGAVELNWNHPFNDRFANAQLISGAFGTVFGTNIGATKEPGEPNHGGNIGSASVWYRWVAPDNGTVSFTTKASNFDTLLGVYTGSSTFSLTTIADNDDDGGLRTSKVTFVASTGVTYYIAVDGFNVRTGNITLNWFFATSVQPSPPANDNLEDAQLLSGRTGTATGTNVSATNKPDEPPVSVWYRWQAPGMGTATFTTSGSNFDTLLAVYKISTVNALTAVTSNDDDPNGGIQSTVTFPVVSGIVYYIAVGGFGGATGDIKINWTFPPAPINDNFVNAEIITSAAGSVSGTNIGASKESGEPNHAGYAGGASAWYKWQAPVVGSVTFDTAGSNFDTLLGIYRGSSLNSLIEVARNDDALGVQSSTTFSATAGTDYYVAVDGYKAQIGSIKLNWMLSTATPTPTPTPSPTPVATPTPPFLTLQIATEADHEYVLSKGSPAAAAQEILSVMNQVEGLYENELGLNLRISYQSAWDTTSQPYTSTNPSTLLSELSNFWNANRGSVARDVVHLWTGKELENATIGTAYLAALCRFTGNGRAAYGLSRGVTGLQQIAITAHEIGHNLGASHPNQQIPQPLGCANTVMSSSVSATPQLDFCPYSANEIATYLAESINCLNRETTHLSFAVPKSLPIGPMSEAAVGDFNNDGKQDLAVTDGDGVQVLLGLDNGEMAESFNYPFGSWPAVGDFDGDGKPDLVLANSSAGTVTILLGTGTGSFEPAGEYVAGKSPSHLVVGDFDVDGRPDIAAISDAEVSVLMNNESGGFKTPITLSPGALPLDLFVGEFNSDNARDLLVAGIGPPVGTCVLSLLRNNGTGSFQPSIVSLFGIPLNSEPRVEVGEINGDGISDVVQTFVTSSGDVSDRSLVNILMGDGMGGLGGGSFQVDFREVSGIAIGDFNGDSKGDVAIAGSAGGGIEVRYGVGTESFNLKTYSVPATGKLIMGDFNGDGNSDLVDLSSASIVLGSTTELQAPHRLPYAFPTGLDVDDFNGDGKQDLVAVSTCDSLFATLDPSEPNATVMFGTGTGDFGGGVVVTPRLPKCVNLPDVTAGDFNNDGIVDIALFVPVLVPPPLKVILGNSSGFDPLRNFDPGSDPGPLTAGDFNKDGKSDLAIASGKRIILMAGGGDAVLQAPVEVATISNSASDMVAADVNRDGILDLVLAHESSVGVLLGTSGGGFLPSVNSAAPAGTRTLTVGDFNFDGKLDVAVGGISVLPGNGDGTFGSPIFFGGGGLAGIAAADFNGDGKTDIAVASSALIPPQAISRANKGTISVLINNTGNLFTSPANDNFANARGISGPNGTLAGTTLLATKEDGEPNHASASNGTGGASIWYRWKAPFTGRFYFQTFNSSFPSVVAVYTGTSVNTLTPIVKSTSIVPEYVELDATAGTSYLISIDGVNGDSGRTVLTWNTGALRNDNFALSREIRGISGTVSGDNTNFTLEPNEPTLPGPSATGFSAWYRWTAPNTGKVSFVATPRAPVPCGDTTRLLGAYTGNFIDILSPVAVNFDGYRDFDDPGVCDNRSLRFNAIAGTTYRIQMRSTAGRPFTLSWSYANPPPNDNFANALILAGAGGSVVGTNRDATKELAEPHHAGGPGGASIWYRWTAPFSGPVTFDTLGFRNQTSNSFRYLTALLAVYTGSSLNGLTRVATNDTADNKVTFSATAGTTYQIAVDSAPYAGGGYLPGIVPLHWGTKQVANDDFANAQPLTASGLFVPLLGSNAGATKETGEPNHQGSAGGTSVWYRWTALSTGDVSFIVNPCITCSLTTANALVSVYTGASVNALTVVPSTVDSNHTFTAVRGTTYFIAVDSRIASGGSYEFSLVSSNISARNDAFGNAQVLSGNSGAVAGDNSGASREIAEPNHANDIGGASVWYQWKAPASGLYTFDTFGSNFDTLLAVYTGNVVSALTVVASSDNAGSAPQSRFTFDAKVDTTYFIAVDGKSNGVEQGTGLARSQSGFILLNWNNLPPPVNDNFANAQTITGAIGNVTGRNAVASKEGGEPNHAGSPGGVSVWYQWTAPSSGNFTFNTFGSDFNTLLGVYTGNGLTALTAVSNNDDVGGLRQSRVTFNAVAGTIYYLAVDGSVGVPGALTAFSGNVVLSWFPETGVSNNNFGSAQQLNGASGSLAATNAGANKESGEPQHAGDRGGSSVWYTWTAPLSGPVLFTTAGSDFDTLLAIYTGNSVNQLTQVASNDDSPYTDNLGHILTSSLSFNATADTVYRIAVDGSGGRFGNFALRWGADAKISGQVSFLGNSCGFDKKVTMLLSGEDTRAVTFTGSGTYTFEHLRAGGNYSVRGVSEISASCLPLFLERAQNAFPLAGDVFDANFVDDGLRGGGSTSNITGHVQNAASVALYNVAIALSGTASRTVYTDNAGLYLLPNLPAGTYQVTPSKAGVVFTPVSREFTFTTGRTITDADFATQDSFNISGQTRNQNEPLSGASITLNNGTQSVSVQTDGNGYYSFDAAAGGSYTLTAAKAGLSFTPPAQSIPTLNANQKNLDFVTQQTQTQTRTLTIASANPNTAVNITVTPADKNNLANGATQFTRTYDLNTTINLTAPATAGTNVFQKWLKDGADYSTSLNTSLALEANHTMTAVYLTTTAQTPAGQNVSVELNGVKVTFATVTAPGTTTITPINPAAAGQLPNAYQLTGDSIAFDITSSATVQAPISVCFNLPSITDAAVFAQLRLLHNENGVLVDRTSIQDFTAKQICANVNSLSPFMLATSNLPLLQLLLEESTSTQAAAVDAVLLLRDPFPLISLNALYPGADRNTRVLVFVKNLQLQTGETAAVVTVNVVDSSGHSHDVAADGVWTMPSLEFSQITFRLPDGLSPGSCTLQIKAHAQVSNVGVINIKM